MLVLSQYIEATYALRLITDQQGSCGYLLNDRVARVAGGVRMLLSVAADELTATEALIAEFAANGLSTARSLRPPSSARRLSKRT